MIFLRPHALAQGAPTRELPSPAARIVLGVGSDGSWERSLTARRPHFHTPTSSQRA